MDIEDRPDLNTGEPWSEMDLFDLANSVRLGKAVEEIAVFLCRLSRYSRAAADPGARFARRSPSWSNRASWQGVLQRLRPALRTKRIACAKLQRGPWESGRHGKELNLLPLPCAGSALPMSYAPVGPNLFALRWMNPADLDEAAGRCSQNIGWPLAELRRCALRA